MEALPEAVRVGDFVLSRKNAPLVGTCLKILRTGTRARVEGKDVGKGLIALVSKLAKGKAADSMPNLLDRLKVWEGKEYARWTSAGKEAKALEATDKAETLRVLAEGLTGVPELKARIASLFTDDAQSQRCNATFSIDGCAAHRHARIALVRTVVQDSAAQLRQDRADIGVQRVRVDDQRGPSASRQGGDWRAWSSDG